MKNNAKFNDRNIRTNTPPPPSSRNGGKPLSLNKFIDWLLDDQVLAKPSMYKYNQWNKSTVDYSWTWLRWGLLLLLLHNCLFPQVFHLHFLLGLQDLLCVWLHVAGVPDSPSGGCMCHHSVCVLLAQCRGLPVAVDQLLSGCLYCWLCLPLCHLLLLFQNKVSVAYVLVSLFLSLT